MNKFFKFVCALFLLSFVHSALAECNANAKLVERAGMWFEDGIPRRIYDLHLTNTGSCKIVDSAKLSIKLAPGSKIVTSWGYKNGMASGFYELNPGQSHSGTGFIIAGNGEPVITCVQEFGGCSCPQSETSTSGEQPSDTSTTTTTTTGGSGQPSTTGSGTTTGNSEFDVQIRLRVLLLGCRDNETQLSAATQALDAAGVLYDAKYQSETGTGSLNLVKDGVGQYSAIVSTEMYCWAKEQVVEIETYEKTFDVKTVILYTYPYPANGVERIRDATSNDANISFAEAMFPYAASCKTAVSIPLTGGIYSYPSRIANSNIATPALYITFNGDPTQYVAAAFITKEDRQRLEFYVDQANWVLYSIIASRAWLQWVTNGIFTGLRRVEFNCHIDDIFMATGTFDPVLGEEDETNIYRITPTDLDNTLAWQTALNDRMPTPSNFTLTFPFNGATVGEYGGVTEDDLYLRAKELRDHFIWESHTFTHPYLDNMTYKAVKEEFQKNTDFALKLFDNDLNRPNYCQNSVITPSISGLKNGEALRAMYELGIHYIVGDNTIPDYVPANIYHGWYTSKIPNGFDGMYVVPRFATEIYYDASEPHTIFELYNYTHPDLQSNPYSFDKIIELNTQSAAGYLLSLRHDPYMFHQANLRTITYKDQSTSLLAWWVDRVIDIVNQYSNIPVLSHTHDDLAKMYQAREARDACNFSGTLIYNTQSRSFSSMYAQSTADCNFAISGVFGSGDGVTYEEVGPEKTMWIKMVGGAAAKQIVFDQPVNAF